MSNKKLAFILLGIAIVLAGGFAIWHFVFRSNDTAPSQTQTPMPTNQTSNQASTEQLASYTMAQVAEHSTRNDCWTVINGTVYDITPYIPMHPGGNEILEACGTDSTMLFTQRTTQNGERVGSGTPHSRSAQSQLTRYQIGILNNAQ